MHTLVLKTLQVFIQEKRIITQSDFPADMVKYMSLKDAVFVTLYLEGRVIASSGRIQCLKENSVYECIDNTLLCLKDPRFNTLLQTPENLSKIHVRVDLFNSGDRRMMQSISELQIRDEGLLFLSQNLGVISVVLPHMIHIDPTPEKYMQLACQKAGVDMKTLTHADYVIYALKTRESTDMV